MLLWVVAFAIVALWLGLPAAIGLTAALVLGALIWRGVLRAFL